MAKKKKDGEVIEEIKSWADVGVCNVKIGYMKGDDGEADKSQLNVELRQESSGSVGLALWCGGAPPRRSLFFIMIIP